MLFLMRSKHMPPYFSAVWIHGRPPFEPLFARPLHAMEPIRRQLPDASRAVTQKVDRKVDHAGIRPLKMKGSRKRALQVRRARAIRSCARRSRSAQAVSGAGMLLHVRVLQRWLSFIERSDSPAFGPAGPPGPSTAMDAAGSMPRSGSVTTGVAHSSAHRHEMNRIAGNSEQARWQPECSGV